MKKTGKRGVSGKGKTPGRPSKETAAKSNEKSRARPGFKKQYLKSNPLCKVTFRLPKDAALDANMVSIVGDFNNWNLTETQMKKLKNGDFTVTLELPRDREYRFRYLVDSNRWENDWFADKYIPNDYGTDDSVVVV